MNAAHFVEVFLSLGLAGLVIIALVEKFAPVVPSYVMLMLLGMTVSDGMSLAVAVIATATGSLAGSLLWYGIGRVLGAARAKRVVARFGKYVFFTLHTYDHLANAYRRNHFWVTLIGQTVPVARIYLALPAGVFRLKPVTFAVAAAIGILLWNTPFLTLGYLLRGVTQDPVNVGLGVSIGLVGVEMTIVFCVRLARSRLQRSRRAIEAPSFPDNHAGAPNAD
jgi:alkaline phosphatase